MVKNGTNFVTGSRVDFVQWNEDAYQAVLVERTKDCLRGEEGADVLVTLDATAKVLKTGLACLAQVRTEEQKKCAPRTHNIPLCFHYVICLGWSGANILRVDVDATLLRAPSAAEERRGAPLPPCRRGKLPGAHYSGQDRRGELLEQRRALSVYFLAGVVFFVSGDPSPLVFLL